VVAASLVKTATSDQAWRDMKTIASTGFRDTTRLALGSPEMHRDITITNRQSISRWIDAMIGTLEDFREQLLTADEDELREKLGDFFRAAQDLRAEAEAVKPRSAETSVEDERAHTGGVMRSMFLGGFGRKKDDKDKRR